MRHFSLCLSSLLYRVLVLATIISLSIVTLHAAPTGPTIYLQDARDLGASVAGTEALVQSAQSGQMRPLAMAEGDLDEDGAMELLVGYATPSGGALAVYRGNMDAFAPQSNSALDEIAANQFPTPLLPDAQIIELPLVPDFVAVGQFNRAGHNDVVIAAKGGSELYVLSGDGRGGLTPLSRVALPGTITAMATRSLGFGHKASEVVVGVNTSEDSALFVFATDDQGLAQIARVPMSAPVTQLAFGNLVGDPTPDIAVVAGGTIQIVFGKGIEALAHGKSAKVKLEAVSVVSNVASLVIGHFLPDRSPRMQMAVLLADGTVSIVGHGAYDARPYTAEEWKAIKPSDRGRVSLPVSVPAGQSTGWQVLESFAALAPASNGDSLPTILRARISSQEMDDVMVLSPSSRLLFVIAHMNRASGETAMPQGVVSSMPLYATPITAMAARVNIDARPGVIVLNQDNSAPAVMMPLPDPTFIVNTTSDTVDVAPGNGVCADSNGKCSLRAAIMEANATPGTDTINVPAGTYTLTIAGIDEDLGAQGDLDIRDGLNIVGAGAGNTVIQAGTSSTNGIEKVFSINPYGSGLPSFNVSLSGLTIQYGRNTSTNSPFGGAMDFDAGTAGTGTLTITNCIIKDNSIPVTNAGVTTLSDGGAIYAENFLNTSPVVTITGTTIQNNTVENIGGAIVLGQNVSLTMTGSTITGNTANGQGVKQGGGIYFFGGTGSLTIHNSTISSNTSGDDGGGIYATGTTTIDQGTAFTGNSSGRYGGGLFFNSPSAGSVSAAAFTGNSAASNGGAIYKGSNAGVLTVQFSRIAGNTAPAGSALFSAAGTVTAVNNWWGSNNPSSVIGNTAGTVTYDPFIVLTHTASPAKIRINQSTTITADASLDNHGNGLALAGNLGRIAGLPVTFNNSVFGTIPQAQPETLSASAQATATFNAGGSSGRGSADATIDQGVIAANSNLIAAASEAGTTVTITTVGTHNFTAGQSVVISGVGVGGYNGTFTITSTPTPLTFTYTAGAGLGASSGGTAKVGIIILAPPQITKSFGAATIPVNGTTTVNFSINNPNVVAINASFTDTLPAGVQVAATPGVTNTCGGTVTGTAGSGTISFSNNLTPVGVCTISVNVTGTVDNNYTNSVSILSTDAGNGNTSSANLTVINPPTITKAFGAATIPLNGTTTLTFNLSSSNQNLSITGGAFTDNLPAGLVVATPANVGGTCTGTVTALSGASSISLSGQTIAPITSCTLVVNVQGTTAGVKNNSVQVTSSNAGTGNTSNASITVLAPPTISKAFGAASIPLNGTTTLIFAINNPNLTVDLSGVAFSDTLPSTTGTLVVASTPGVSNTCGGTVTATSGAGVISLSGASVVRNTSCTLTVNVTGTAAGDAVNTTGAITSTQGGTGTTSNTAILKVVAPPTITKAFGAASVTVNGTTTLTFTITDPAANTTSETGIAFSDTLTGGLQVASTPGVSNTCGGTVTAAANSTSINLSGGSIVTPGSTCTIVVNVTGTQSGTVTNTTGAVSSTNGGTGATSNTATLIVASPATVTNVFGATKVPLNGITSLTINITNPNTGISLSGLSFTDSLPAGLVVATPNGLTNTCGGTATATAGSGSVSLSGGTSAASSSCAVTVNVQGTTTGTKNNSMTVSSTEGGASTTANATITVVAPPSISKAFGAASIPLNGTTTVTFTISNPNNPAVPANGDLTGVAFSDTLPVSGGPGSATLVVSSTPNVSNTCGGTVTATAGTGVISLSGGSVAHNASCTLSVDVRGTVQGDALNTTGAITSTEGGTGTTSNTATLKVVAPPTIIKAFGVANLTLNGTTTLTFTITNPASNTSAENGVAFSDTLTNGLQVASTPGVSNTCGGTVTAAANSTSISLSGGSIATPGATCTIVVNVTGTQSGTVTNTTGAVSSTNGGTGATSNTATLTVASPPSITKAFGASQIPLNGTTSLTFTIQNPNGGVALSGIAFTDSLPAGTVVASTPSLSNTCGGTATAGGGAGSVSLSGGTVAASASCTVSVNVQGTTAGTKNNSVQVTSTEGGTGNTSNASVAVVAPPTISKAFGAASIPLNGTTSLVFTITNPNTTTTLNGIAFSDTVPANLKMIGFGSFIDTCNGVTSPSSSTVNYSGMSLAANSSCTLTVTVKGIVAGDALNTTGAITSSEGGTGTTSNTASLSVVAPPTISKAFGAVGIPVNGTTTVTFTITNPAANTTSETGIAFSDTLTSGLQVASTPGVSNTCGGSVTAVANSTSISLTGGSIATPGASCTIVVNVTGTQSGTVTNTTGAISSTNGGTGATSNTATLTVASPPTITKVFGAATVPLNGTTSLTFTIQNPNSGVALSGIAFTDNLPAGTVVASTPNLSNTCGGTATAVGGAGSMSLSGGVVATSATCTVSVNVQGTTAGVKNNSVQVTSTESGTGNTSNASITVVAPPTIIKDFAATSIPLNGTTMLVFQVHNNNTTTTLTGVAFSDTLPAGLVVSTPNGLTGSCGGGTITAAQASNSVSLTGASIAAGTSCTFSVNVTGTAAGLQNNTTGNVTSTEGGTGGTASASLNVEAPPSITKVFTPSSIALNATTSLTFTITNPAANTSALTGVAFTDTLPTGLTVANASATVCGGTLTTTAPSGISLTGATINTNSQCPFSVTVTGAASGQYTNTTGNVTSTNGGTGNTATATLTVASPPTIAIAFGTTQIPLNGTTTLTFTIQNSNTGLALNGVGFIDNLPAGLTVASTPNLNSTCGGTATAVAGSGTVSLAGGTLAANTSCAVTVDVTGATAGAKATSAQVTSTEGGTGNTGLAIVTVVGPPVIIKAFGAASVPVNGSTSLSFTIQNNNDSTILSGIAFSDTLPAGLVISTPNALTGSCGSGPITATAGSNTIGLTGGRIAPTASCTFSVNVTGTTAGLKNNTTGNVTSTEGGTGGTASASISVVAPPSMTKSFNPDHVSLGGSSTLGFDIVNPAANTIALTGVAFTDVLPSGLSVPSMTVSYCGGTLTMTAPSTITLSGATIAAGSHCNFGVGVQGNASGVFTNTTGAVTSTNGGTGNTATATLTVASPPTINKVFGAATIPLNGTTSLTFTIQNPAANTITLTGIGFADNLPAGLVVASPSGLNGNCGGTTTAVAGAGSVSLSAGTLAANSSCQVSVNVTGSTAGVKNNSVVVSSTEGGLGNVSNASITVVGPPVIIKAFGAASIQLNASTSLTFTIQNNNSTTALTGVGFTDTFPAGLVIATPNGLTGSCGGGTITAPQAANTVSLSGASMAAGSSCTFSVNVTGTTGGFQNNTTGNVTSNEGGTGGTASASINVLAPDLTIASAHTGSFRQGQTGASYALTVSNEGAAPTSGTVTVVDTLPSSLTATAISGTGWTCALGTLTCTRADSLAISGSYPAITVTVNVANNTPASVTNSATVSGGGEVNTANDAASDSTTVVQVADLTVTKSHTGTFVQGVAGSYSLTVNNVGPGPTLGTVTVTDTLPTGLTATAISGTGWTCTLATLTCTRTDVLNNAASYPAIVLNVNTAGNAPASLTNTATVSGGGELNTANNAASDVTTIQAALTLTSRPLTESVVAGNTGSFTIGVTAAPGVTGPITLSCAALPVGATCEFQPGSVSASTTEQLVTLSLRTSPKYLSADRPEQRPVRTPVFYAMLILPLSGLVLVGFTGRKKVRMLLLLAIAAAIIALSSCGGGQRVNPNSTPPGTYAVSVTAGNGTSQAQTVLTLTVQ